MLEEVGSPGPVVGKEAYEIEDHPELLKQSLEQGEQPHEEEHGHAGA